MIHQLPRGVGVEGSLGPDIVGDLAALAEARGYASFWFNVLGPNIDPFALLQRAVAQTTTIEIGAGVFPLDAYPAADFAPRLADLDLPPSRVIIGVAAGQIKQGAIGVTEEALSTLGEVLPGIRIATGGYGPKMLELGGRRADVVLGNWLTAERLDWVIGNVAQGATAAARPLPPIYLYHRAATGPNAIDRLKAELVDYRRYPAHQKHQAEMGNPDYIGVATSERSEIAGQLAPYGERARVVLKPLAHDPADPAEWRQLIEFFAPAPN